MPPYSGTHHGFYNSYSWITGLVSYKHLTTSSAKNTRSRPLGPMRSGDRCDGKQQTLDGRHQLFGINEYEMQRIGHRSALVPYLSILREFSRETAVKLKAEAIGIPIRA
jgi:hypothetical protein